MFVQLNKSDYKKYGKQFAEIHSNGYSKDHLTANFSKVKLIEYYQYLVDASDVTIIANDTNHAQPEDCLGDKMLGFIVAGEEVLKGVNRFLINNRVYVLFVVLRHPGFIWQKAKAFLLSRFKRKLPSEAKYRLLSICIDAGEMSRGLGKNMLGYFEDILISRGIKCYGLSVRKNNSRAISFYERNGFSFEKEFSGSCYYIKNL